MSDAITVSAPISGTDRTLTFEAGKLAQLADGAVVGRIGDIPETDDRGERKRELHADAVAEHENKQRVEGFGGNSSNRGIVVHPIEGMAHPCPALLTCTTAIPLKARIQWGSRFRRASALTSVM